jgi:CheY-like chemotaxis protein
VHVISIVEKSKRGATMGAFAYLEKPVSKESLEGAFQHMSTFLDRKVKLLLLVEDNSAERATLSEMLSEGGDVEVTSVSSAEHAIKALDERDYDCMVVDLVLPEQDGFKLIEQVKTQDRFKDLPIVVYTSKDLSAEEDRQLKKYAESVIVKSGVKSPERLLNDTALFLHRVEEKLPDRAKELLKESRETRTNLAGKKVLIVDDDVRNIFAMTSVL